MSFSFSPGMGPRGAIDRFGQSSEKEGRLFDRAVVLQMLVFIRPYWRRMLASVVLMLIVTGLSLLTPYLIKVAIDQYITNGDVAGLSRVAIFIGVSYLALYGATATQQYLLGWVSQRVLADLRENLFRHLQSLSLSYHDRTIIGVTVSRVINDVAAINDLLTQGLISLLGDMLVLIGIIVVMLSMSTRLALYTFTVLPLMAVVTYLFSWKAKDAFRLTRERIAAVVGFLAEHINGMRVIQAFAQESAVHDNFVEVNDGNRQAYVDAMRLSFIFLPGIEFLGILSTGIVIYFGGRAVADETVTLGIMVAFLAYVTRFFQPIQELSRIYTIMQSAMAGGEQVMRLLNTKPAVLDYPDAIEMPEVQGEIILESVSFRYREDSPEVLHEVDLRIEPGQTVALVGPTGAGKTTIANLIPRFYEVSEGSVKIDGIDVREVTQKSLHRQMGLVPQDPFLFAGTIAENISFGRLEADMAEIREAAHMANAANFIEALPEAYETRILEGAVNLSVGQRQLLCIARAALIRPNIFILDEATASVDTVTEVLIQEALDRLMSGRTAIIIAHRLSTIRNADKICVILDGRIAAQGRHDELIEESLLYRELYEKQFMIV
jgi:ABC-type multidrug transport system fused ATPase/permease subunit